jgi:hypothetical protein
VTKEFTVVCLAQFGLYGMELSDTHTHTHLYMPRPLCARWCRIPPCFFYL